VGGEAGLAEAGAAGDHHDGCGPLVQDRELGVPAREAVHAGRELPRDRPVLAEAEDRPQSAAGGGAGPADAARLEHLDGADADL
jgi:hypothetical protein